MIKLPKTFYYDVESMRNYVIYGDTDSLYLNIKKIKPKTVEEAKEKAAEISKLINNNIIKYNTEYLLPKLGIDPKYNETFFKTELIAESIMLLDVKKSYAYKLLVKDGLVLEKPKIKYTGIGVVRSDASAFTVDFLTYLIEDIALENKKEDIKIFASKMHARLLEDAKNFVCDYIGIPCKWGGKHYVKEPISINGMKLFNEIVGEQIFTPLSGGLRVFITKNDVPLFMKKFPKFNVEKTTSLVIPHGYESEKISSLCNDLKISIDVNAQWNTLFTTTCKRIMELLNNGNHKF